MIDMIFIGVCGFLLGSWWTMWRLEKRAGDAIDNYMQELASNTVRVHVRQSDDGVYFVYDAATQEFLVQGKDPKEIAQNLSNRFPSKFFIAVHDNLNVAEYPNERL